MKMADSVVPSGVSSHILPKSKGNISQYVCNKRSVYETQLKEALEELGRHPKKSYLHPQQRMCVATTRSLYMHSVNTKGMDLVPSKNDIVTPNKNDKGESTSPDQLIITTNRFTPLSNLQANNTDSSGLQEQKEWIST
jgi:hypothetical protein